MEIQGKDELSVTITNNCKCPQSQIMFLSKMFQTIEPVDPAILEKQGDGKYLLLKGKPLEPSASVTFKYAWDYPFSFAPIESSAPC